VSRSQTFFKLPPLSKEARFEDNPDIEESVNGKEGNWHVWDVKVGRRNRVLLRRLFDNWVTVRTELIGLPTETASFENERTHEVGVPKRRIARVSFTRSGGPQLGTT